MQMVTLNIITVTYAKSASWRKFIELEIILINETAVLDYLEKLSHGFKWLFQYMRIYFFICHRFEFCGIAE